MGLPIIGGLIKAVGEITGLSSVKDVVDAIIGDKLTPEQKLQLNEAAKQYSIQDRQIDTEQMKLFVSEAIAEINSPSKFVSFARPLGLYFAYLLSILVVIGMLAHWNIDHALVAEVMLPLYGAGGYYMHLRTREKLNGQNGH